MKVLVTGAAGQLGQDVVKELERKGHEAVGVDRQQLDITDAGAVHSLIADVKPDAILHCAAYTNVDKAEEDREGAYNVNALGSENLAKAAADNQSKLLYVSTDYVFDGETDLPYTEDDFTNPLGVYGASKLEGENLALEKNPKTIF